LFIRLFFPFCPTSSYPLPISLYAQHLHSPPSLTNPHFCGVDLLIFRQSRCGVRLPHLDKHRLLSPCLFRKCMMCRKYTVAADLVKANCPHSFISGFMARKRHGSERQPHPQPHPHRLQPHPYYIPTTITPSQFLFTDSHNFVIVKPRVLKPVETKQNLRQNLPECSAWTCCIHRTMNVSRK